MSVEAVRRINRTQSIDAEVLLPPSKSYTNRALIVAALAKGTTTLIRPSSSDDSTLLVKALRQFGVGIRRQGERIEITGSGGDIHAPTKTVVVGNAGTTMRFLSVFACLAKGTSVLDGDERMRKRPIGNLLTAMQSAGVHTLSADGFPPVTIHGGTFSGGKIVIDASVSSQFVSAILLSAPYAHKPVELSVRGDVRSLPYIEMTLHVMRSFGAQVLVPDANKFDVDNSHKYLGREFQIEADATAASYFLAAAALLKGRVVIPNLPVDSLQGDLRFLEVLSEMGCIVQRREKCLELLGAQLRGIDIDMNSMPDCVPTLAVLALFAKGPTRISNVKHLRYKETNRLEVLAAGLQKLGGKVDVREDGLTVYPGKLCGAEIETCNDHRIAMSFAIAGLGTNGVAIKQPSCVSKSFPNFWDEFEKLEKKA